MTVQSFLDVTPILMLIALGVVLRLTGLIDQRSGLVLTRLAYHVTIPAAIFTAIARSQLTPSMVLLPAIAFVLPILLAAIIYLTTGRLASQPQQRGVMLSAMVVLGVFGYPFFQLFFGEPGLARMGMYDVGNALFAGTVSLWLAQRFGTRSQTDGRAARPWLKVITSPVLVASVLGVAASAARVPVSGPVGDFLTRLANANTPLAMLAVGVFVRPRASQGALMVQFIAVRMVLGGLLGLALALVLGMAGLDLVTACAASTLPCGTTVLIYAGNEGLDTEFAASLISVTVIIGSVLINILPHLLARLYM